MSEKACQVFCLQCACESQMFSCLFHKCHHGQQVEGPWEEASEQQHSHLRCTCVELLSGPRDFVLKRK